MKWCRVEFDVVVEITDISPEGRFHPDFGWVECGDDVEIGWLSDAGELVPPASE